MRKSDVGPVFPEKGRLRIIWAQYRESRKEDNPEAMDCFGRDEDNWMQCPDCSPDVTAPGESFTIDASGKCCATCDGLSRLRPPLLSPDGFEFEMIKLEGLFR
jgi:hypothetical protein